MYRRSALALLLATTALPAAAEITLDGSARLGLGFNIDNEGEPDLTPRKSVTVVDPETGERRTVVTELGRSNDLTAVSRVRFGVTMAGESDSGVSFGASIRADNAHDGGTGASAATGQTAGEVFVSGAWGTLNYGDVDGADYNRVADAVANLALTGLGDFNELPFLSNSGGSDNDTLQFVTNPDALPTIRYDYDHKGFGLSLSTDRTFGAVGVGASYAHEFEGEGSVTLGVGYYDFSSFTGEMTYYGDVTVPDGHEWSTSLTGTYRAFNGGVAYTAIDAGSLGQLDTIAVGGGATYRAWTGALYYTRVLSGDRFFGEAYDHKDSFGASLAYALGGGAEVRMGVVRTFGAHEIGSPESSSYAPAVNEITLADFGVKMEF